MKVIDIINSSAKPYPSLEIVPPLGGISKDELLSSIEPFMEFSPKYINVTCHRDEVEFVPLEDGTFKKRIVRRRVSETAVCGAVMSRFKVEMVPHLICGGSTESDLRSQLQDLKFLGISNVMALRGDSVVGEKRFTPTPGGYSHASEMVSGIRSFEKECGGDFCIGVGGYPEKHFEAPNRETDIANLRKKVDEGADYIITQMFFDNSSYYDFVDRCRAAGITVPIIPGIKPISSMRQIELLPQSFSIDIPKDLSDAILKASPSKDATYRIGIEWAIAQCKDLLSHGVPAIHFYTMGKARNVEEILRECF